MDDQALLKTLEENLGRIEALVQHFSDQDLRWKPDPDSWSMLEVINHLADEEVEDFSDRLRITLQGSGESWKPIDPEGWVTARGYNERDPGESLDRFRTARQNSLAWLSGLEQPDWKAVYQAPFGAIAAGDLLASWVTHDQLHLRQLIEIQRALVETWSDPFSLDYGGEW